jgi:23S rRNA pseudouridine2605 synthase
MKERLQKILSARGVASRRKAEEMITAGRVFVNGVCASLGDTADPELDQITVDGDIIPSPQKKVYIMLHKPRGYVTTLSDEKGRRNAAELVADCGMRVYPVGRLDMDSEGLLLFTNDGDFAQKMMHPSHEVDKTYLVTVKGYTSANLELLKQPVTLDGYTIKKPKVRLLETEGEKARLEVVIHEGRNRQVRRMCELAGMEVVRLVRITEGSLRLGNLPRGKWRYLTDEETAGLL